MIVAALTRLLMLGLITLVLGYAGTAWASGEYIDIAPKNQQEIQLVLDTLEASINAQVADLPPIVMMLHGDEARRFLRRNYQANKAMIDQTAKLAAHNVIKVQICATWLELNNYDSSELFPFISTVPFGAGELERLASEEGYSEFSVNL